MTSIQEIDIELNLFFRNRLFYQQTPYMTLGAYLEGILASVRLGVTFHHLPVNAQPQDIARQAVVISDGGLLRIEDFHRTVSHHSRSAGGAGGAWDRVRGSSGER